MKRKILSLILAASFAAALVGCGAAERSASSAANSPDGGSSVSEAAASLETSDTEGTQAVPAATACADNALGNLTNSGGFAVTDGEWIYFRSNKSGLFADDYDLMRRSVDGETVELIRSGVNPWWLNLYDGYLYYCDQKYTLSRMPVDGSEVEILSDRPCNYSIVADGWIYFVARPTESEPGGIYKMKTDGTSQTFLAEGEHHLQLVDNWLYYIKRGSLWRVSTDGAQNEAVPVGEELESYEYVIHDGWLYTASHRYKLDGSETTVLNDMRGFVLLDDRLYYGKYEGALYRSNLDGTGEEMIWQAGTAVDIHVLGNKIYLLNSSASTEYWLWLNTDGSGYELVPYQGEVSK